MRRIENITLKDGRNLKEVLESHKKWLEGSKDGKRAYLVYEDLSNVDFNNAYLKGAILINTDLTGSNLLGVDLTDAKLIDVDLKCAYLRDAILEGAYLEDVELTDAYLRYADFIGAVLIRTYLTDAHF